MFVHVDMDAFFACVEQLENPALRGHPVIIAGGTRSVVSTASYEARRFGIHSAMPAAHARKLCPEGIFVLPRHEHYAEISRRIMGALAEFSPELEPASIDEAYLDVSGCERLFGPLPELVRALRARVREVTGGLTCSVGAAPLKFLAKICSDINKPNGVFILEPEAVDAFLLALPIGKIPGVGRRMAESLAKFGIRTAGDMRRYSREFFSTHFGRTGLVLLERAQGIDPRGVVTERCIKSESAEETFERDTLDRSLLLLTLLAQSERVAARLRWHGLKGRTVTVKIKFADFTQMTRSRSLNYAICSSGGIYRTGREILQDLTLKKAVRLIGIGVSNFRNRDEQQSLLSLTGGQSPDAGAEERRSQHLETILDTLRARFGADIIHRASLSENTAGERPGKEKRTHPI